MRLRSCNRNNSNNVWNVNTTGNVNNNNANNSYRCAPDCITYSTVKGFSQKGLCDTLMQGTEIPAERLNNTSAMQTTDTAGFAVNAEDNLFDDDVIGFDALYKSMMKCKKGVMWKASVASYRLNAIERTIGLMESLHDGTYKAKPPMRFKITHPKPREIASVSFRDRVYQRSLNDNAVYSIMTRSFIYDNYACQKGKGTDFARNRLKEFLRRYYRKHGINGYVYQFDIKGYYPNMSHEVCENTFRQKLDDDLFRQVQSILREQYDCDKGYNAGSQLIQIAGISVLDSFDHFIKENLHAELHGRYMDDFFIIHESHDYLMKRGKAIEKYLDGLHFKLHETKSRLYPLKDGIEYLGFTFRLTETGKVLMLIKSDNVKAERKKLYRLVKQSKLGKLPKSKVDESYAAWRNHASKGNCFHCIQRMDAYYKSLWN